MLVNQLDREQSPFLTEGVHDLVLEAQDELLFGLSNMVFDAYVVRSRCDVFDSDSGNVWNDGLQPKSRVSFRLATPKFGRQCHGRSKMVRLCRVALRETGVLPDHPVVNHHWRLLLAQGGFCFHDALYGSRVRAFCRMEGVHLRTDFAPVDDVSSDEWALRRNVALGVTGAAEVLVDFMVERELVQPEIAQAMLRDRVEQADLNAAVLEKRLEHYRELSKTIASVRTHYPAIFGEAVTDG